MNLILLAIHAFDNCRNYNKACLYFSFMLVDNETYYLSCHTFTRKYVSSNRVWDIEYTFKYFSVYTNRYIFVLTVSKIISLHCYCSARQHFRLFFCCHLFTLLVLIFCALIRSYHNTEQRLRLRLWYIFYITSRNSKWATVLRPFHWKQQIVWFWFYHKFSTS